MKSHRPHYIARNHANRQPACHIVIDTEATITQEAAGRERQTFGCAVAVHYHRGRSDWREPAWLETTDPAALWAWVDRLADERRRTIVVAHNLAYDLRIAQAFAHLPALGWKLERLAIDARTTWAIWRDHAGDRGRTLVMVDSIASFPMGLDKIATALGMHKLPLPPATDTPALLARCRRDVEILAAAWTGLLDWLRADDLGNWQMTGSSQAWAAWRHRFMEGGALVVHGAEDVRAVERAAGYCGRVEAWRHGPVADLTEWDFAHAYAGVIAREALPRRLVAHGERMTPGQFARASGPDSDVIVNVELEQEVPVAPMRDDDGIAWPVGRFATTLWGVELREAIDAGAVVHSWGDWWGYELAPIMARFGQWCCDVLDGREPVPPAIAHAVKHWSRAIVGRTSMRYPTWQLVSEEVPAGIGDWCVSECGGDFGARDDDGEPVDWRRLMFVAGQAFADTGDRDAPDSTPMILSYVQCLSRIRLWRAMNVAGLGHVAYVDTDSMLVDHDGHRALNAAGIPDLRVKSRYALVEVLGPRQLYLDGTLRVAGLPGARTAQRVAPATFDTEVWRSLAGSAQRGEWDSVVVEQRRVKVHGVDRRREHVAGGATLPKRLGPPLVGGGPEPAIAAAEG